MRPRTSADAFPLVVGALEGVGGTDLLVDLPGPDGEGIDLEGDLERLRLVVVQRAAEVVRGAGEGADREQEARVGRRAVAGVVDRSLQRALGRGVEVAARERIV